MASTTSDKTDGFARRVIDLSRRMKSLAYEPAILERAFECEWRALADNVERVALTETFLVFHQLGYFPTGEILFGLLRSLVAYQQAVIGANVLFGLAVEQKQFHAAFMFFDGLAALEMSEEAARRADAKASSETLGHLKTMARLATDVGRIGKLSVMYHPSVVACLLNNSHLTEPLVLKMASLRPTRPEPLWEIWKSRKWSLRPSVRRAIAFNPYAPPGLTLKLLPLLGRADWRELTLQENLHPMVRRYSAFLLGGASLEWGAAARED